MPPLLMDVTSTVQDIQNLINGLRVTAPLPTSSTSDFDPLEIHFMLPTLPPDDSFGQQSLNIMYVCLQL